MKKYIDYEEAYIAISNIQKLVGSNQINTTIQLALKTLKDIPGADVRSNNHVRKEIRGDGEKAWFCCSNCHKQVNIEDKFCRHCGSDFTPGGVI